MTPQPADSRGLEAWVRALDERADPAHADITPAVLALIDLGLPGAEAVLDRLNAPERLTRKRAQRVIEGVVAKHFGWVSGRGYSTSDPEKQAQAVLSANAYDADAPESERLAALGRWRQWLAAEQERARGRQ